jgi:hypothetical protein
MFSYRSCALVAITVIISVLVTASAYSGSDKNILSLKDFDWEVSQVQKESSITMKTVSSSLFTGFDYEDFKPKNGVTVVTLRLKAKQTGEIRLVPELFIIQRTLFYEPCKGFRIIEPKPRLGGKGFTPAQGSNNVSSHDITEGQTIVIDLAFDGNLSKGQQLLAASPMAIIPDSTTTNKGKDN